MNTWLQFLISNALLATALALVVLIVGQMWRNPKLLHALWVVVLLKFVTPPLVTIPIDVVPATNEGASTQGESKTAHTLPASALHDLESVATTVTPLILANTLALVPEAEPLRQI